MARAVLEVTRLISPKARKEAIILYVRFLRIAYRRYNAIRTPAMVLQAKSAFSLTNLKAEQALAAHGDVDEVEKQFAESRAEFSRILSKNQTPSPFPFPPD